MEQNTEHPIKKDLPTNSSAQGDGATTTQGQVQRSYKPWRAMQGLGFLHLRPTFQKLVRQHDWFKALLTVEIGKAESLMEKENL